MRHHVRKTNRAAYSKEQMQLAVASVMESGLSVREPARLHDVNYKILGRYVKVKGDIPHVGYKSYFIFCILHDCVLYVNVLLIQPHGCQNVIYVIKSVRQVFIVDMDQLLVGYVKKAAQIYHGLTPKNIREPPYKLAQSNSLQIPPMWASEQIAGVDWFAGFMSRHPTLSIREP